MKTALIYHPIFLQHDTGPNHPERSSRLTAILRRLQKTKLIDKLTLIEPEQASIDDITTVHARDYVLDIKDKFPSPHGGEGRVRGVVFLDPDTVISKDSFEAALFAAGAVKKAADLVFK